MRPGRRTDPMTLPDPVLSTAASPHCDETRRDDDDDDAPPSQAMPGAETRRPSSHAPPAQRRDEGLQAVAWRFALQRSRHLMVHPFP